MSGSGLRIAYIGGTGIISSACVRASLARGDEVVVVNRNRAASRPLPEGVRHLQGDVHDHETREQLAAVQPDVVANFVAFTPDHVRADLESFADRVHQYVFISSASAYQTPPARLPIVESTPLGNPYWRYSAEKIACEEVLVAAQRAGAPVTIVRPSHTYDRTSIPLEGGWTTIDRMRRGRPVVVHGDGTSLWVLTHHRDFAEAFVALTGHPQAIGDTFHITSDEVLTWNQIYEIMADAAGATPQLVHVASETIAHLYPEMGPPLLGDKAHSVVFDNTKVRSVAPGWTARVPFWQGAREIVAYYDAEPSRRVVDAELDRRIDRLVAAVADLA
jgi:nucleoside-diphosphate-sugar epimerase